MSEFNKLYEKLRKKIKAAREQGRIQGVTKRQLGRFRNVVLKNLKKSSRGLSRQATLASRRMRGF